MPPKTSKTRIALAVLAVVIIVITALAVWATNVRQSEPAPGTPTSPPTPTAPATQLPYFRLSDAQSTVHASDAYTLNLNAPWFIVELSEAGNERLASLVTELVGDQAFATTLIHAASATSHDLIAMRYESQIDTTESPALLIISTLPRQGLYLESYIAALDRQVSADSNFDRTEAVIRDDLRPDLLPVAVITMTAATTSGQTPLAIYQVALYDTPGDHLIILSFLTDAAHLSNRRQEFDSIVAAIELPPPN